MTSLPQLIKKVRKRSSLTQANFGQLFNPKVAQPTVARWEKGEQVPERKHLPKLASLLSLSLSELFELIDDQLVQTAASPQLLIPTPNQQHLAILNQGTVAWNQWREKHPQIVPQLAGAEPFERDLERINLSGADLRGVNFHLTNLDRANFSRADLSGARLTNVSLSHTDLRAANFSGANLNSSYSVAANLSEANFSDAVLGDTNFYQANFKSVNFSNAHLNSLDLRCTILNRANFEDATLKYCRIYGISAWGLNLKGAIQVQLDIGDSSEKCIYVDDLRMAYIKFLALEISKNSDEVFAGQLQQVLNQALHEEFSKRQQEYSVGRKSSTIPEASLVNLSREIGWIKARHVQQKFNGKLRPRPETIRDWFLALEAMGKGRTRGNDRTLEFFAFSERS